MNSIKHFSLIALSATMSFGGFAQDGAKKTAEQMRQETRPTQTNYTIEGTKAGVSLGAGLAVASMINPYPDRYFADRIKILGELEEAKMEFNSALETEEKIAAKSAELAKLGPPESALDFYKVVNETHRLNRELEELRRTKPTPATSASLKLVIERKEQQLALHNRFANYYKDYRKSATGQPFNPEASRTYPKVKYFLKGTVVLGFATITKEILDILLDPSTSETLPEQLPAGVSIVDPSDASYAELKGQALDLTPGAVKPDEVIKKLSEMGLPRDAAAALVAKLQEPVEEETTDDAAEEQGHN